MLSFIVTCSVDFPGKLAFFFLSEEECIWGKGKVRDGTGRSGGNIIKKTLRFRRKQCHANAIIISILAE